MKRWQRHFVYLYQNGILVDLIIAAGEGDFRKEFRVHRVVVSIIPRLLKHLKNMPNSESTMEYPHIDPEIMELLIQYVYTGSLPENPVSSLKHSDESSEEDSSLSTTALELHPALTFRNAIGLFEASAYFKMHCLMDICAQMLYDFLDPINSLWVLQAALGAKHSLLIQETCAFICENGNHILKRNEIEDVHLETLEHIIKQDNLLVSSEAKVFHAVYRWGLAECERQEKDSHDPKEIRSVADPLLKLVRYRLLSSSEFQKYVLPTRILKKNEMASLFTFFMSNKNGSVDEDIHFISKPRTKIIQQLEIPVQKDTADTKKIPQEFQKNPQECQKNPQECQEIRMTTATETEAEDVEENIEDTDSFFEKSLLSQPSK